MPGVVLMENAGRGGGTAAAAGREGTGRGLLRQGQQRRRRFRNRPLARQRRRRGARPAVRPAGRPHRRRGGHVPHPSPSGSAIEVRLAEVDERRCGVSWRGRMGCGRTVRQRAARAGAAAVRQIIEAINASGARVLAVDIPSGLDADTGQPQGPTIRAQHTATIAAAKKGFARPQAAAWLGQVHVIDMGGAATANREYHQNLIV